MEDHTEENQGAPVYRLPIARHVSEAVRDQLATCLLACQPETLERVQQRSSALLKAGKPPR